MSLAEAAVSGHLELEGAGEPGDVDGGAADGLADGLMDVEYLEATRER